MRDSFVLYTRYADQINLLGIEQRGTLLSAIYAYVMNEELPDMDGMTKMAFSFIKSQLDTDFEKYDEVCRKRSEAGKAGGRPKANASSEKQIKAKKAKGFSEKQTEAKKADNDNEYDNDNENDKDNMSSCTSADRPMYPYKDIIDYLNQRTGSSYRSTSRDTQKHIRARMDEGYTLDDFRRVIDNKSAEWGREPKPGEKDMRPYLRPSTLFGTKFESYLNEPGRTRRTEGFNNFERRNYDMDALERALIT